MNAADAERFVQEGIAQAHNFMAVLELCGGKYICPKTKDGKRAGPLVPYRATDEQDRHLVGDLYANCAKVERWPKVSFHLARQLRPIISERANWRPNVYCGAPEGGKHLADKLAQFDRVQYVYPEKKGDELIWGRHEISPGDKVVIVEDVSNNFTTTDKMIHLILQAGAEPVAIASYLNRSPHVRDMYQSSGDVRLPICALVNEPWPEYTQDDPAVAADIAAGNIVRDVKKEWSRLMTAMNADQ